MSPFRHQECGHGSHSTIPATAPQAEAGPHHPGNWERRSWRPVQLAGLCKGGPERSLQGEGIAGHLSQGSIPVPEGSPGESTTPCRRALLGCWGGGACAGLEASVGNAVLAMSGGQRKPSGELGEFGSTLPRPHPRHTSRLPLCALHKAGVKQWLLLPPRGSGHSPVWSLGGQGAGLSDLPPTAESVQGTLAACHTLDGC